MAADVDRHHLAQVTWRPADPPAHGLDSWPAGKRHWLVGTGGLGCGRKPCMERLRDSGLLHTERWEPERQDPTPNFLSDYLERSPVPWKCSLSSKYFWRDQTQETPLPQGLSSRSEEGLLGSPAPGILALLASQNAAKDKVHQESSLSHKTSLCKDLFENNFSLSQRGAASSQRLTA